MAKGGGADTNEGYWFLPQVNDDQLLLKVSDGTLRFNADSNIGIGLTAGKWHHVCAVFDRSAGSDTAYFYLDGNPVGSETDNVVANNSASSDNDFQAYLDTFIYGAETHAGYLDRIGKKTLEVLRADPELGYCPRETRENHHT